MERESSWWCSVGSAAQWWDSQWFGSDWLPKGTEDMYWFTGLFTDKHPCELALHNTIWVTYSELIVGLQVTIYTHYLAQTFSVPLILLSILRFINCVRQVMLTCHQSSPGWLAAILSAKAGFAPPALSATALTSILQVGGPYLCTSYLCCSQQHSTCGMHTEAEVWLSSDDFDRDRPKFIEEVCICESSLCIQSVQSESGRLS